MQCTYLSGEKQARFCEFVDHLRWPSFPDAVLSRTWMSGKVPQYDVIVENSLKRVMSQWCVLRRQRGVIRASDESDGRAVRIYY